MQRAKINPDYQIFSYYLATLTMTLDPQTHFFFFFKVFSQRLLSDITCKLPKVHLMIPQIVNWRC